MKNNFQKILLFLSLALLFLFCLAFLFLYQEINNNSQKTQQDAISLQIETKQREEIASLDQALQKISSDKTLLENHFIKSSDIVPFLNTLEKLAARAGVSAQIDSVNTKTDNSELIVGLKALGKFEAIYKFLTLLENSPYVLDFMSMNVQKLLPSDMPGKNVVNANWEAVIKIKLLSFVL